jgi:hypothetical protein
MHRTRFSKKKKEKQSKELAALSYSISPTICGYFRIYDLHGKTGTISMNNFLMHNLKSFADYRA